MKTFAKILATVVALLLIFALIAPMILKDRIAQIVKTEANKMLTATLDFEELDISLLRNFPNASLGLEGLTLVSGVEPFVGDTIVAAEEISVVVNLASLFGDEGFEVRRVLLDEPRIHGHKSSEGRVNWDVMKVAGEPEAETSEEPEAEADSEPSAFRLALRDVTIRDAVLRYDDDSTQMYASVTPLNLSLRGDFSAARSTLKLKTLAQEIRFSTGGMTLANGLEAELNADIDADLEKMHFALNKNTFRLNAIEMMIDGEVALKEEATEVDLKLNTNKVEFREILSLIPAFYTKDFEGLKASGELTLGAWAKGRLAGDRLPAFGLELGIKEGSFKYSALPQSVTGIRVAAKVENPGGTLDATRVDVSDFGVTMAGNSLSATLQAATPLSDLQFSAAAKGKVDLGAIKEVYPLDEGIALQGLVTLDAAIGGRMSDIEKQRFEQMQASGTITVEQMQAQLEGLPTIDIARLTTSLSPAKITLGECRVKIGRSDLSANGELANFLGWALREDTLKGHLYLKSELLDLNELMGSESPEEGVDEHSEQAAETPTEETPAGETVALEVPKNLDLDLQTSLAKLLFQQMTITDFTGNIDVKGGRASLSKLAMQALGGSISASGSYSTAEDPARPALQLKAEVKKASFSETFNQLEVIQKMVPLFRKTGGDYSMSLDLSARMHGDMSLDLQSINAKGELRSGNIQLQNLEIFTMLTKALKADKVQSTLSKELVVKFAIQNGRLSTQPFDLNLGSTSMNISGSTGLDQTIDYTARVSLPGKAANVLQNLDVKIGGTFSSPKISVDLASAAKEAVSNVVNEQIQKLTGSENLNAEISKQAEKLRAEARAAGDKLVAEAEKQKQALVDKASNKLAKLAAEKAGEALVKEARKQADKLVAKAEEEISKLENKATGK